MGGQPHSESCNRLQVYGEAKPFPQNSRKKCVQRAGELIRLFTSSGWSSLLNRFSPFPPEVWGTRSFRTFCSKCVPWKTPLLRPISLSVVLSFLRRSNQSPLLRWEKQVTLHLTKCFYLERGQNQKCLPRAAGKGSRTCLECETFEEGRGRETTWIIYGSPLLIKIWGGSHHKSFMQIWRRALRTDGGRCHFSFGTFL